MFNMTVMITGAASGIGLYLADAFWKKGIERLILVDRDSQGLDYAKNQISKNAVSESVQIQVCVCDISSNESVLSLGKLMGDSPIDILVNNAGVTSIGNFEDTSFDHFENVVGVNLIGTARVTKQMLGNLRRGDHPVIINMSSLAGLMGAPGMAGYSASKFGIIGLSDALRAELKGAVDVVSICPAFINTGIAKDMAGAQQILDEYGRKPEDVVEAVFRALKHRRPLELIGVETRALLALHRLSPGIADFVVQKGYDLLKRRGVFGR